LNNKKSSIPSFFQILLIYFGSLLLLSASWRLIFLLSNFNSLRIENLFLYFHSFWIAIRLDAVIASYFSLPFFLIIILPYIGWQNPFTKKILFIYVIITYLIYSLIAVIDIEFYKEFNTHLNILAFQSNAYSKELWHFAFNNYPIFLYFLLISLIVFIWIKLIKKQFLKLTIINTYFIKNIIFFFISFILIGTCIRGGWQERPIDWGHAMFSENHLANQIALNPLFNWGRSIIQLNSEKNISKLMNYMDNDLSLSISRELIKSKNEYYIDSTSFKRKILNPKELKPNVILIVLESFLASYCGFINTKNLNVTPNLNNLANKGINCTNAFASGKRSAYGLSSILCSWPVLPGFPLISQLESQNKVETIGTLLKKINYSTHFIYGGDADFDNMKGFVIANGFDKVIDQNQFSNSTPRTMWGIYDEYIFDAAESILDTISSPTLITLFTTTNHQPWLMPENKKSILPDFDNNDGRKEILNTMYYTDHIIGQFINKNKNKLWYENSIFIFIADHGFNEFEGKYEDPRNAHIPLIFYSEKIIKNPKKIETITSQVDVLTTLLHIIGYKSSFNLMGKNILDNNLNSFATRIINDHATWINKEIIYTEIFNQKNELYKYQNIYLNQNIKIDDKTKEFIDTQTQFHAYLQQAYTSFKNK